MGIHCKIDHKLSSFMKYNLYWIEVLFGIVGDNAVECATGPHVLNTTHFITLALCQSTVSNYCCTGPSTTTTVAEVQCQSRMSVFYILYLYICSTVVYGHPAGGHGVAKWVFNSPPELSIRILNSPAMLVLPFIVASNCKPLILHFHSYFWWKTFLF